MARKQTTYTLGRGVQYVAWNYGQLLDRAGKYVTVHLVRLKNGYGKLVTTNEGIAKGLFTLRD